MEFELTIAMLQNLQAMQERKKAYNREYMKNKWYSDPVHRDKHRAYKHGLSYEEYVAKKAAGEIKRGRPRKNPVATA